MPASYRRHFDFRNFVNEMLIWTDIHSSGSNWGTLIQFNLNSYYVFPCEITRPRCKETRLDHYICLTLVTFHEGFRLRNFEIRVGMDSDHLGNNAVCYKQIESMESGQVKKFTCNQELFGDWVSINKTETQSGWQHLHFREIDVFGSKCIYSSMSFSMYTQHNFCQTSTYHFLKAYKISNYMHQQTVKDQ